MIIGVGLDVVAVERVARMLTTHGERFRARCFSPGELVRPGDAEHVAGLLAAKEAAFKALGTGWGEGVGWRTVTVGRTDLGGPVLDLDGAAAHRAARLGVSRSHLSITHAGGMAIAVVVLEA
ncbi:MAG: holo-ACP synthase [Acidobacteriota bacterium]